VIVQRSRLGQLLVAAGSIVLLVAVPLLAVTSLLLSTDAVADAAPDLLAIDEVHDATVVELTAVVPTLYPPGVVSPETADLVAERMVRDSGFVEGTRDAAATAHESWLAGGDPQPTLGTDVLGPAALAAFRDVDLALSRDFPTDVSIPPASIDAPVTTTADTIRSLRTLGVGLLVAALAALLVGAILDRRFDRALRWASTAILLLAAVLAVAAIALPIPDLTSRGWLVPAVAALVEVSRTTILLGAAACALLGAFLRASASQVAPLVAERERRRARAAAGPAPAASGAQVPRRRGRAVRQQAIDAFFEESEGDDFAEVDDPAADEERPLVAFRGDGFDEAIAAVEADPRGGTTSVDSPNPDEGAAADRREALERIDGARSRLRTHLPR
jgi:hypothetical protein